MQNLICYVTADKTVASFRDEYNAKAVDGPTFLRCAPATLKLRLFANDESTETYPAAALAAVENWVFVVDNDFAATTTPKLIADNDDITVATVTETIDGSTRSMTEISIPITDMNPTELATLIGDNSMVAGLIGELAGYDDDDNLAFCLQLEGLAVRNRVITSDTPSPIPSYYRSFTKVTSADRAARTWEGGVPLWDTTLNEAYIGDGNTSGGVVINGGEVLTGYVMLDNGSGSTACSSARFIDCASQTGCIVMSGAMLNRWEADANNLVVYGGTVKNAELKSNEDYGGNVFQFGGVVSSAIIHCESGGSCPCYTITGGTLCAATVNGKLHIKGSAVVCSAHVCYCEEVNVSSGAILEKALLDGGIITCESGGIIYQVYYLSGTYISGGTVIYND